jgi:tRNA (mo5U34)-methyltransferase
VAKKVKRLLVFQTLTMPGEEVCAEGQDCVIDNRAILREPGWSKMAFIEHRFAADPSNWWIPNHAAVEAMLRSSGLRVVQHPGHEIYLCQPDATLTSETHDLNMAQFMAATGRGQASPPAPTCP